MSGRTALVYSYIFGNEYIYIGCTTSPKVRKVTHMNGKDGATGKYFEKYKNDVIYNELEVLPYEEALELEKKLIQNEITSGQFKVINKQHAPPKSVRDLLTMASPPNVVRENPLDSNTPLPGKQATPRVRKIQEILAPPKKQCCRCGYDLNLYSFGICRKNTDGLTSWCNNCRVINKIITVYKPEMQTSEERLAVHKELVQAFILEGRWKD